MEVPRSFGGELRVRSWFLRTSGAGGGIRLLDGSFRVWGSPKRGGSYFNPMTEAALACQLAFLGFGVSRGVRRGLRVLCGREEGSNVMQTPFAEPGI